MNTVDAIPHSMADKEKRKELLLIFAKFTDNLAANTTIFLSIGGKTSKSIFKGELSDVFEHFFEPLFRFLHIYYTIYFSENQIFIVGGWCRG